MGSPLLHLHLAFVLPAFAIVHRPPGGHSSPGPPASCLSAPSCSPSLAGSFFTLPLRGIRRGSIFGPSRKAWETASWSERRESSGQRRRGGRCRGEHADVQIAPRGATACAGPSVTPPPPGMASCGGRALTSLSQSTSKRGGDKGKTPLPSAP